MRSLHKQLTSSSKSQSKQECISSICLTQECLTSVLPACSVSSLETLTWFLPQQTSSQTGVRFDERDSPTSSIHQPTIRTELGCLLPVVHLRRLQDQLTTCYNLRWLYKKKYNDREKDKEEKMYEQHTKYYILRDTRRPDYKEKEQFSDEHRIGCNSPFIPWPHCHGFFR